MKPRPQIGPLDELHHDVDLALMLTDLEDLDDVRMGEARHRLGLAEESGTKRAANAILAEQLDGDSAVEERIAG